MGATMVHELVSRVQAAISKFTENYDIILVNDCSPDDSWNQIVKECLADKRVKGINLSRNFGQHCAITAGLNYAKGDWVIVMDCDLQDRPEEIGKLYQKALEGYDIVLGERAERTDGFFKKLSSTIFHKTFIWLSGIKTNKKVANFGIYKQSVIEQVCRMPERDRGFGLLVQYLGFKTVSIPIEHGKRFEGESSYTLRKMLKLAFDNIISHTNKPLRVMVSVGFLLAIASLLMAFYNVLAYLFGIIQVPGFTTTVFSIWFVGGLIMTQLGIVGIYIGKVFDQVKGRPLFVVMDKLNIDSTQEEESDE
jgi:dolichol-phosphate mannosyltransferase